MPDDSLDARIEAQVERLGFEFVELERAGSRARPVLRVRIDRPDSEPGHGVTLSDCTAVSRALETFLDTEEALGGRYVLEVSSPGLERPLLRPRDFRRFAGREVALKGYAPLAERSRRLEGELLGLEGEGEDARVLLRLQDGETVSVPRGDIARAHLIFRWDR